MIRDLFTRYLLRPRRPLRPHAGVTMPRAQRTGPNGERPGRRVQCTLPPPAQLAGKCGKLVREIQNGRQWLIEWDNGEEFHTPTGKSNTTWLWTTDFALLDRPSTDEDAKLTRALRRPRGWREDER